MLVLSVNKGKFEADFTDTPENTEVIGSTAKELAEFFKANIEEIICADGYSVMCSSTVDFCEEYDFEGDARQIVSEAFTLI